MSGAIKGIGKVLKPVAQVALPAIGYYFGGPLGAAVAGGITGSMNGGGLSGALKGAAMSGLSSGLLGGTPGTTGFSLLDSANSSIYGGLSPLREFGASAINSIGNLVGGENGILGGVLGKGSSPLGAISGGSAGSSGATSFLPEGFSLKIPETASAISQEVAGGNQSLLESLWGKVKNNPLGALSTATALLGALKPETMAGTMSQEQILAEIRKREAAAKQQDQQFIASLNSGALDRKQVNPNVVDYYKYGERPEASFFDNANPPATFKKGGRVKSSPLNSIGGQADTIDAKLSEGEYVIPADVVSSLGDGNSLAGAKQLDAMLKNVRKQKAPAMRKGVLPPRAKSPLAYAGATK
jgi:hypothetical protein